MTAMRMDGDDWEAIWHAEFTRASQSEAWARELVAKKRLAQRSQAEQDRRSRRDLYKQVLGAR